MSSLWRNGRSAYKFYYGGLRLYPEESMYKEMAFISYYFHWPNNEVMELDHRSRRQWCREISAIHKSINPSSDKKGKEKSILDFKVP